MTKYYVRVKPQLNGENAVHKENCPFLDGITLKKYLGEFVSSVEAIMEAKKTFSHSNGCPFCTKQVDTQKRYVERFWNCYSLS